MKKVRIGIICPSEIAYRRFMPAIQKCGYAEYAGVAHANEKEWFGDETVDSLVIENEVRKARLFADMYGGKVYDSYESLLASPDVDAVYLPLPPALHFQWARTALENGKHVFLEKPFTSSMRDTDELLKLAEAENLAVHENYMFVFHRQIEEIKEIIGSGRIGDVRLYRIAFGFPQRAKNDFRYNKDLGGGALLDCGGYTLKLAAMLLGDTAQVVYSRLNGISGFEVDMYGSAALVNDAGVTAQVAFGMDNGYKCELEVWGSKGSVYTGRILTAPDGLVPVAEVRTESGTEKVSLSSDDAFEKSISFFCECVNDINVRKENYATILKQARLVDKVQNNGGKKAWK